jgi:hypothetical protein
MEGALLALGVGSRSSVPSFLSLLLLVAAQRWASQFSCAVFPYPQVFCIPRCTRVEQHGDATPCEQNTMLQRKRRERTKTRLMDDGKLLPLIARTFV